VSCGKYITQEGGDASDGGGCARRTRREEGLVFTPDITVQLMVAEKHGPLPVLPTPPG